jgi:glycosyltransferase involved in cell wall biosynthesis
MAREAGVACAFLGRVPREELPAVYRAHDVLAFPSTWREPFGLTHLEAMASGLPVVSTLAGGQREFLVPGENCLAFETEDAAGLADALDRLRVDLSLGPRLAEAGMRLVRDRFTLARYVDDLERFVGEGIAA